MDEKTSKKTIDKKLVVAIKTIGTIVTPWSGNQL